MNSKFNMTVQINKNKSKKLNSNRKQDFKFHFFFSIKHFISKLKLKKMKALKNHTVFFLFLLCSLVSFCATYFHMCIFCCCWKREKKKSTCFKSIKQQCKIRKKIEFYHHFIFVKIAKIN